MYTIKQVRKMTRERRKGMKKFSFKRGIHPDYHKDATCDKPIEVLKPKEELVFPMQQNIGAPCQVKVKKGERVLLGQKIGEPMGYVGAPIYSTVSGTVKIIEERMTHQGVKMQCVVITNDYMNEEVEILNITKPIDYTKLTKDEIIQSVKEAGIVGMGGASFPTFIKLSPPEGKVIKNIIINGAECEPYLTSDHRVMLEEGERVVEGIRILLQLFPEATASLGIEDNKKNAIKRLEELMEKEDKMAVKALDTKYPQGSEKHLIYAITNQEVPGGGLPADIGCVVVNIDSVVAIWRAVTKKRPLMRRIVTVGGSGVKNPSNFKVRLGMSFRELLESAGWDEEKTVKVIAGGPMMGMAISNVDVPVVKGTSAILCFTEEELSEDVESNCLRCGKCVQVCPMKLIPSTLHHGAIHENDDQFVKGFGMDCIECGSCSYICPAKRKLVQTIRTAKNRIRQKQK